MALLLFFGNAFWPARFGPGFSFDGSPSWLARLLDGTITAASVMAAYWGTTETILFVWDAKKITDRLKKLNRAHMLVVYFGEALFSAFLLLLMSVAVVPVLEVFDPVWVSSLWLGLAAWSMAASLRAFIVLSLLLRLAAKE